MTSYHTGITFHNDGFITRSISLTYTSYDIFLYFI